jgi:predicted benzoate:H+ symporter BenE
MPSATVLLLAVGILIVICGWVRDYRRHVRFLETHLADLDSLRHDHPEGF